MKELDPGHKYELETYDGKVPIIVTFVKREGLGFPGNIGHHPGTNLQENMRAEIARLEYLQWQAVELGDNMSAAEDLLIILSIRENIYRLEQRAARRHGRHLAISEAEMSSIETMPTCTICGHIDPTSHLHGD